MTGGSSIEFPQESPQEAALRGEQVELLRQQRDILSQQMREQQLLAPILYGAAGIKPIKDEQGQTIGYEQIDDPLKARQDEVASRLIDRQLAALKGELPDNPALLKDLATQETTLNQVAQAPNPGIPVPGAGYSDTSLTQAGSSIGKAIKQYRDDNLASNARMGGSAERTEADYQAQRAGEREDMSENLRQFGDDNEHLGIMGASMGGSRTFTKKEVRQGYRRLG